MSLIGTLNGSSSCGGGGYGGVVCKGMKGGVGVVSGEGRDVVCVYVCVC